MENFTEFDIYIEPEEEKTFLKQEEEDIPDEGDPLDSLTPLSKEDLISLTRSALLKKKDLSASSSPQELAKIEAKARDVALNIAEWVYLSADAGEWKFVYDMNKLGQDYLNPTLQALRIRLPDVYIQSSNSRNNRWIEISWKTSNEV